MICALGDLLLDVVVRLDGPIAEDTDTYGRTRVSALLAGPELALRAAARSVGKLGAMP